MAHPTDQSISLILSDLIDPIKQGTLRSKVLAAIMTSHMGGSDAAGLWTWREAYDLMQSAAIDVVCQIIASGQGAEVSPVATLEAFEQVTKALPTETRRSERQMVLQQFSTPLPLAWVATCAANLTKNDVVLEPSAGLGALARMAEARVLPKTILNEIDPFRAALLGRTGVVTTHDAEFIDDLLDPVSSPSVILMNPPFASSASRSSDPTIAIRHIISAAKRLQAGGRLVAIVPSNTFGARQTALWDRLSDIVIPTTRIKLPSDVFYKLGTTIETNLLIADKPLEGVQSLKTNLATVECSDLAQVLDILEQSPERLQPVTPNTPIGLPIRDSATIPVTSPNPRKSLLLVSRTGSLGGSNTQPVDANLIQTLDLNVFDTPKVNEPVSEIYASYAPQRFSIAGAGEHPTSLVESLAMGTVAPPEPNTIPIQLPSKIVSEACLSEPQLETLIMAETSFSKDLPGKFVQDEDGNFTRDDDNDAGTSLRQGYFLGDGTGCGKGRQVAGIILAGWLQGRTRAIWVSKSATLIEDARRDWADLGGASTDIHALSKWKADVTIPLKQGILFVTYATLRAVNKQGIRRLDQILDWLGNDFEGVIAFDEAHAMQNAGGNESARGASKPSQQGLAGLRLQNAIPRARILYVSATGATTLSNLAYATRLGLWGQGGGYPFASRDQFISSMEAGGVAAMEVVARDLKAMGLYTARALSFEGVEYDVMEHKLTDDQIAIYDTYAGAFKVIHQNLHAALKASGITGTNGSGETGASASKAAAISAFESTKQRFFNHLLQGLKAPAVIEAIKSDIDEGWSPVVQIVSTGEALLKRRIESLSPEDELVEGMLTPREYVQGYLENAFPVALHQLVEQEDGCVVAEPVRDDFGQIVVSREAEALRDDALEQLMCLAPVPSALDQLIWGLGTDIVAEVTGRSKRPIKSPNGRLKIEKRGSSSNSAETKAFMDGDKSVLIFSDAGGTGRSYQAASTAKNQNRRRHYLLEPGWRADNAIQGLGRTHRAAQVSAPFFRVCTTDVHGEKRFTSTIARRLDTLGALTKGQRETASQGMFRAEDNLESPIARSSLRSLYADLIHGSAQSMLLDVFCEWTGLRLVDPEGVMLEELPPIQRFLNRVLALPIHMQNSIFTELMEKITNQTERHLRNGTLDVGLETLHGDKITAISPETLRTCEKTGSVTALVQLTVLRELTYLTAEQALDRHSYVTSMINRVSGKTALISSKPRQVYNDDGSLDMERRIVRPNKTQYASEVDFAKTNWEPCSIEQFRSLWATEVADLPNSEEIKVFLLTGLILPIWKDIPGENSRIYRASPENAGSLLGRALTEDQANVIRGRFTVLETTTPDGVISAVKADQIVDIGNGLSLIQRRVAGQLRFEIDGADRNTINWLKTIGCFTEIHQFQLRVFVPNGIAADPEQVLAKIMGSKIGQAAA